MFQASDFVAGMDILSIKLDVCLPLAYPSTVYKHFSSLMPLPLVSMEEKFDRKGIFRMCEEIKSKKSNFEG